MIVKVLFPLNSGAGLGSEVIEDTVHAVDLGGDAICDMLEKLEGNILDGGGHCVTGIDRADDDGVSEGAGVILNADRFEIGHDGEILPDLALKAVLCEFVTQDSVGFSDKLKSLSGDSAEASDAEAGAGERLAVDHAVG